MNHGIIMITWQAIFITNYAKTINTKMKSQQKGKANSPVFESFLCAKFHKVKRTIHYILASCLLAICSSP